MQWRLLTALLILCLTLSGTAVRADQNDRRLDALFGNLQVVETPHEARMLERVIWGGAGSNPAAILSTC